MFQTPPLPRGFLWAARATARVDPSPSRLGILRPVNGEMRRRRGQRLIWRRLTQIGREIAANSLDRRPVAERPQAKRTLHQAHSIKTRALTAMRAKPV